MYSQKFINVFFSMQNYHWISEKQQPILRTKIPRLRKCKNIEIYEADSIERNNRYFGFETRHPLVNIVHFDDTVNQLTHYMHFGFYALFLKNTTGCKINYGNTMSRFEILLDEYLDSVMGLTEGTPTVKYFADKVC